MIVTLPSSVTSLAVTARWTNAPLAPEPEPASGNTNPTLAFGLSGIADWNTGMQFIDLMKMARPWTGHENPFGWGGMSWDGLKSAGYLDEKGWLTAIPEGFDRVGTIWAWNDQPEAADGRTGIYVVTYEGEGQIAVAGGLNVVSTEPGRIVFEKTSGNQFFLDILDTDPEGTGNYIRNISIVHERHLALHEAGGVFNPEWLALIKDARQIRFMDWQETNNSTTTSWDERTHVDGLRTPDGVAVEDMVHLANLVGADPWFCMPHMADDAYILAFATYVRDNLDPSLTARVEYSNEAWNFSFSQAEWLRDESQVVWGAPNKESYYAKMAVNMALIWRDVFADEPEGRLVTVLATQISNPWVAGQVISAPAWQSNEPDAFVSPSSVFDELAITTYFGGRPVRDEELRDELIAAINDPETDADALMMSWMLDPEIRGSIPWVVEWWEEHAQLAQDNGMKLVAYEGGQHVHHLAFVAGLSQSEVDTLTSYLSDFVRSHHMAELYQQLWDSWAAVADGPFMQFVDVGQPSKWGSWGTYSHLGDQTPRTQLLEQLNATSQPWWETDGGEQYLMGVIGGTVGADGIIAGTTRKDILIGDAGDNIFLPGPGNDQINGVAGTNRVILSGEATDYAVTTEGAGYRVTGPGGSKFMVNVQTLTIGGQDYAISGLVAT